MYFLIRWICRIIIRSFFREVQILNQERIPRYGPVIFVGNHNNQFVDATMMIAHVPRDLRFLIADKSLKHAIVGPLAKAIGAIPVFRSGDKSYTGMGRVVWKQNSNELHGKNTRFMIDIHQGDKIKILKQSYSIKSIESDTFIILEQNIDVLCTDPSLGVTFLVEVKINNSQVYTSVTERLLSGDGIAMFPEGGSHDRTTLLPLKPGVAVMALSAAISGAEDVMIVPVGFTYYQAHQFQSRATVNFGMPILITDDLIAEYQENASATVSKVLNEVEKRLLSCIITAQDYKSMRCIKLCCSLYPPERLKLTNERFFQLHQMFSRVFWQNESQPELIQLQDELQEYRSLLKSYPISDHQVWLMKQSLRGAIFSLVEKLGAFCFSLLMTLPTVLLWAPIRLATYYLVEKHRKTALSNSVVKLRATDVIASYKIKVLLMVVPAFNMICGFAIGLLFFKTYKEILLCTLTCLCIFPILYHISMQNSTKIIPYLRQIKTIFHVIFGRVDVWRDTEREIITRRAAMQIKVRQFVENTFSTEFEDSSQVLDSTVPKIILNSDSKRLMKKMNSFMPMQRSTASTFSGEIL